MRPLRSHRASVLVIVLVTLMFATAALVLFVQKAGTDLLVDTREATARRLRQDAYSTLEVTIAVLDEFRQVNGSLRSPAEGWGDPLKFSGWTPREGCTAEVTFEDESGKLSLPHVDAATLVNLFKSWEFAQSDAEKLADALLGWMKKDYVPTSTLSTDYERGDMPYAAPLRPLRSYDELAAIDYARDVFYDDQGRPNENFRRFVAAFSLFDYTQSNINSGRSDVLSALGSFEDAQKQPLLDYLQGKGAYAQQGPGFLSSTEDAARLLGSKLPAGFGTAINALRVNITVREGRSEFHLSAVLSPPGGATAVLTKAATTSLTTSDKTATTAEAATAEADKQQKDAEADRTASAQNLKYPFTLLEIRENAEISAAPPDEKPEA